MSGVTLILGSYWDEVDSQCLQNYEEMWKEGSQVVLTAALLGKCLGKVSQTL